MIASDLASQIDAFKSILTGKDEKPGELLVRRKDLKEMMKLSESFLEQHEIPLNMSMHDMEISCGASRIEKELG